MHIPPEKTNFCLAFFGVLQYNCASIKISAAELQSQAGSGRSCALICLTFRFPRDAEKPEIRGKCGLISQILFPDGARAENILCIISMDTEETFV